MLRLLAGCCLERDYEFSGYPAAVFHVDALGLGPLADLNGVQSACRCPVPATGGSAGGAADPPPGLYAGGKGVPQLLGVLGVQVDLILGAVESEADRDLGGAAVEVVQPGNRRMRGRSMSARRSFSGGMRSASLNQVSSSFIPSR